MIFALAVFVNIDRCHKTVMKSRKSESLFAAFYLCKAVKARLASRSHHKHTTAASSDDESFAQMLARITKARAKLRRA